MTYDTSASKLYKKRLSLDQINVNANRTGSQFDDPSSIIRPEEKGGTSFTKPVTPNVPLGSKPEDWPSKLKGTEWLLKYPAENENVPTDWQNSRSVEADSKKTMPDKKVSDTLKITTIPDKKDTYTVAMTTMPSKTATRNYDYPDISIEGEDSKLSKLFKSIPKD